MGLFRGRRFSRSPTPPRAKGLREHELGRMNVPKPQRPSDRRQDRPRTNCVPQLPLLVGLSCHSTMNTKPLFLGKRYLIQI